MGNKKRSVELKALLLSFTCFAFLGQLGFAQADSDTPIEGLSLPAELQTKAPSENTSAFDDVRIHGGASLINSWQDYSIAQGVRERGGIRGFQLNLGIDLFSSHWIAEGDFLYFPESQVNDTRLSSSGFELRVLYEMSIVDQLTFHLGGGIGNRSYTVKTSNRINQSAGQSGGQSVKAGDRSFSSGATALVAGIDYWPSPDLSLGVELSNHLPLANGDDPTSIEMGIKVNGHF